MKRNFKFSISDEVTVNRWTLSKSTVIESRRFTEDVKGISESYFLKGYPFWFNVDEIKLKTIK